MATTHKMHYRQEQVISARASDVGPFTAGDCRESGVLFFFILGTVRNRRVMVHLTFVDKTHGQAVARLEKLYPDAGFAGDAQAAQEVRQLFSDYLHGRRPDFEYPIWPLFLESGTELQRRVWQCMAEIPCGVTRSYGELARQMGNVHLARAVGQACHRNPLALLIPCHRVVGSQGIGGFAGGLDLKKRLLGLEKRWRRG